MKPINKIYILITAISIFILAEGYCNLLTKERSTLSLLQDSLVISPYNKMITPESLAKHLYIIASDSFEGRGTGERGQKMAAQYIASQYRLLGLQGVSQKNNCFQSFELYDALPIETRLEVMINGKKKLSSTFSEDRSDDLSYYLSGAATNASAGLVFAGYGIADDTLGYNDLAALSAKGISIKDKWVLLFANEPTLTAGTSLFHTPGHKLSGWSRSFRHKRLALWKAGQPKGILVIKDAEQGRKTSFKEDAVTAGSLLKFNQSLFIDDPSKDVPQAYAISTKMADLLLSSSGHHVKELKETIDQNLKPIVFSLNNINLNAVVKKKNRVKTENIFAFLEGSDPSLKNEIIVLSAHYDHLGIDPALKGDQLFNGAADDGSGTAALLEMAKAFKKAKDDGKGPRRSILFASFSGEEMGHLGSLYFTNRQPLVPLAKIVADINMDGVAGIDPKHPTQSKNYIYIAGEKKLSQELIAINKKVHSATGSKVELTDAPPGFSSDHESFADYQIPFIYYSTGFIEHYHQVTDEPGTIDYDHMNQVIQLIFAFTWQVANQDVSIRDTKKITKQNGYVCRPCNLDCDAIIFTRAGTCPACNMILVPRFKEE